MLLLIAAWRNLHQLNPDAVAYLRIAGYYADGRVNLAVTGYWGPLLSWLIVPLLKAGAAPLAAARVAMAVSGMVFLAGALAVFRTFRLPRVALLTGAYIATGWSVFWSVRHITPDLLMAGIVALAVSATMGLFLSPGRRRLGIAPAVWWGAAFLAKAIALPLALLTTVGLAALAMCGRRELQAELLARLGTVWLGIALVAGPWIAVLSFHYERFTFSTTGSIAHALAGVDGQARYHPAMVTLHQPDTGRVTQWEEPSRMAYQRWSPLASEKDFRHQFEVAARNFGVFWDWLSPFRAWLNGTDMPPWRRWSGTFDLLGISALAVLLAGGCVVINIRRLRREKWCWALLPVVALGGLYLPFFVMPEDARYFYLVLPFVWVLAVGAWGWMGRTNRRALSESMWRLGFHILSCAFVASALLWLGVALAGIPNQASRAAHILAGRLRSTGQAGPIAGSGLLPGGRTGLYTAFLLGERWLGEDVVAGPAEFAAAGARVVVLCRDSSQAGSFARDPRWRPSEPSVSMPLLLYVLENPEQR